LASPTDAVLVTGASGFTGRRLMAELQARGVPAFGLDRRREGPGLIAGDLSDAASLQRAIAETAPRAVVHLAGVTFVGHADVAETYDVNVTGTVRLLEALRRAPARPDAVIVASSATVYARADETPITEDHPLAPGSHYGMSKLLVEQLCGLYRDLPIRIVRPFNYTGPGQSDKFLVPKIVSHFARDTGVIELGSLDLYRDIGAVDDTVEAYVRLLERPDAGPPLNICSGRAVHLRSIVDDLRAISGKTMEVVVNPAFVRPGEPRSIVGSRVRLEAAIGGWPLKPFREVLEDMYAAAAGAQPVR
jgi:nucleoside-diphosphate-sugar epimerase